MARPGKSQINAFITKEAREGFRRFCAAEGVNLTALLQALGEHLGANARPRWLGPVIARAQEIEAERLDRRPNREERGAP